MFKLRALIFIFFVIVSPCLTKSSDLYANIIFGDGYDMWLRYVKVSDESLLEVYRNQVSNVIINSNSKVMKSVESELKRGLGQLLEKSISFENESVNGSLVVGTPKNSKLIASQKFKELSNISEEGYLLKTKIVDGNKITFIVANTDIGVLYGTFAFLRKLQTQQNISSLYLTSSPKMELRMVNHWDNLDRSVERGYAGISLWDWKTLPKVKNNRYVDFARLSASIGINAIAINNVNADPKFITVEYLDKIAVLANIFRAYGIKIFLSVNYASPIALNNLKTADPENGMVKKWWRDKVDVIYSKIPDFGGFLVKADSEGQPGPKTYGRNHAVGANMLAKALEDHKGLVLWRAFVYGHTQEDRVREAFDEFVPLDGEFKDNVILQIKNGPLDFMPREPFSPLFGAMKKTNLMVEFQVTQEYLGNGNHLVFKAPMFKEVLDSDTFGNGNDFTVAKILEKKVYAYKHSGMTAVVNPGMAPNWTKHPFVQSSWYAFGRLAWDYNLSSDHIAEEWIKMTFSNDQNVLKSLKEIMKESAIAAVEFREPLGLTHIGTGAHYGPAPWSERSKRFHRASKDGLGYDRTASGSNAIEQYNSAIQEILKKPETTPEKYLLWFHHLPWNYKMKSGNTLWDELVSRYYEGVERILNIKQKFTLLKNDIDKDQFRLISTLLSIQFNDAKLWRNSCVLYFQQFSEMPIPDKFEHPDHELEYYRNIKYKRNDLSIH